MENAQAAAFVLSSLQKEEYRRVTESPRTPLLGSQRLQEQHPTVHDVKWLCPSSPTDRGAHTMHFFCLFCSAFVAFMLRKACTGKCKKIQIRYKKIQKLSKKIQKRYLF